MSLHIISIACVDLALRSETLAYPDHEVTSHAAATGRRAGRVGTLGRHGDEARHDAGQHEEGGPEGVEEHGASPRPEGLRGRQLQLAAAERRPHPVLLPAAVPRQRTLLHQLLLLLQLQLAVVQSLPHPGLLPAAVPRQRTLLQQSLLLQRQASARLQQHSSFLSTHRALSTKPTTRDLPLPPFAFHYPHFTSPPESIGNLWRWRYIANIGYNDIADIDQIDIAIVAPYIPVARRRAACVVRRPTLPKLTSTHGGRRPCISSARVRTRDVLPSRGRDAPRNRRRKTLSITSKPRTMTRRRNKERWRNLPIAPNEKQDHSDANLTKSKLRQSDKRTGDNWPSGARPHIHLQERNLCKEACIAAERDRVANATAWAMALSADLPWRSRLVRLRTEVREALGSNPESVMVLSNSPPIIEHFTIVRPKHVQFSQIGRDFTSMQQPIEIRRRLQYRQHCEARLRPDFRTWESCPDDAAGQWVFSGSPVSPALAFRRCSKPTLNGSQDLNKRHSASLSSSPELSDTVLNTSSDSSLLELSTNLLLQLRDFGAFGKGDDVITDALPPLRLHCAAEMLGSGVMAFGDPVNLTPEDFEAALPTLLFVLSNRREG
ncbi:hypothetical protein PR048_025289 [Dryococelus australis]|uniref:Uncharacterized protein n=1 Tax=Dryococelus australis TaxID=614101 RepID=A0ABQ9GR01_9NEOP|nr:hypothetical protein PR048_025289 [Dryococelus australis]